MVDLNPAFSEPEQEEIFPKPYKCGKKRTGKRQEEIKDGPIIVLPHTLLEEELFDAFQDSRFKNFQTKYINA